MSVLVLILLVGGAFALNHWLDLRAIVQVATERGWGDVRISWAPFARFLTSRRGERHYWLSYLDEGGRAARRLCKVVGLLQGTAGVFLEPVSGGPAPRARPMGRAARIAMWAGAGAFVGLNLGIAACFVIFPGSNIAPAYGVILGAPLGLVVGALLGARRRG